MFPIFPIFPIFAVMSGIPRDVLASATGLGFQNHHLACALSRPCRAAESATPLMSAFDPFRTFALA